MYVNDSRYHTLSPLTLLRSSSLSFRSNSIRTQKFKTNFAPVDPLQLQASRHYLPERTHGFRQGDLPRRAPHRRPPARRALPLHRRQMVRPTRSTPSSNPKPLTLIPSLSAGPPSCSSAWSRTRPRRRRPRWTPRPPRPRPPQGGYCTCTAAGVPASATALAPAAGPSRRPGLR